MKPQSRFPSICAILTKDGSTQQSAADLRSAILKVIPNGVIQIREESSAERAGSLVVTEAVSKSEKCLDDLCRDLGRAIENHHHHVWHDTFRVDGGNYTAVFIKSNMRNETNDFTPPLDEEKASFLQPFSQVARPIQHHHQRRRSVWGAASGIFLIALVTIAFLYLQESQLPAPYYDTSSSEGPRYSYLLTPDNITGWAGKHYDPAKYFVRLDEQALVPIELLDEQEMRYQQYLQTRYPEKAEMRDSRAWLDPEFFHDPNNFMLPTDMEFHRGHCIRVFRRYWQAKETGRHVCPWDIDYRHLHHCFSMLEDIMLPPGPRTVSDDMTWSVSWRTKVCSWEPS